MTIEKLKKAGNVIFVGYMLIASFIFLPYYNWQYANENGFGSWLFLGEFVPSLKAFAWPYFAFIHKSSDRSKKDDSAITGTERANEFSFNANEQEKLASIFKNISKEELSEPDLQRFRDLMKDVTKRIDRYLSLDEAEAFNQPLIERMEYRDEFGKALLASWDKREYITTKRFDDLYAKMERLYKDEVGDDIRLLKAASLNQKSFQDSQGNRMEFSRNAILFVARRNDIMRANLEKITTIIKENAR